MGVCCSGNTQGVKELLGSGDRFGQDWLLLLSLESSCWELHRRQCERSRCVSCCCHSRHEVDVAHPWVGLPRCVRVPGLLM